MHGIAFNELRDEIAVTNPLASAAMVFRGGANGNEAPLRVIQGPKTKLKYPHAVAVDVKNNELLVLDPGRQSVLVFPWDANGDVAPLRVIEGPKTKLKYIVGVGIDYANDLLVVSTSPSGADAANLVNGLLIFNRTDNGDVAPRGIIEGPKTGIETTPWQLEIHEGKIYLAIANIVYRPLYSNITPRAGVTRDTPVPAPWASDRVGFIGVWKTTDNGDVPPLATIKGPGSRLIHAGGIALNPKHKEIFVVDGTPNGLFTYLVPEFFAEGRRR
jgi:hypothetical protein